MTSRRFNEGDEGSLRCGFDYRVIRGKKGPTDLILQIRGEARFRHVPMELGFLITDFMVENEGELYLEDFSYQGGDFYLNKLVAVKDRGWRPVAAELWRDREAKRHRDGRYPQ